jgi:NADPH-dependent ferric siderophore reductase
MRQDGMSTDDSTDEDQNAPRPRTPQRLRREPPQFRRVAVRRAEALSARLLRVTLAGDELAGLVVDQPAASVRLLLPSPGTTDLVMPAWNGNEFRLPDGQRPVLRTFTPRHVDAAAQELDVDVVLHGGGAAEAWATTARPGDPVAVSGPGRGYDLDPDAPALLLAGDETALPAIGQLLEHVPAGLPVQVHVEVARPDARLDDLVPGAGDDRPADIEGSTGSIVQTVKGMLGFGRRRGVPDDAATGRDDPGDPSEHITVRWYDLPDGAPPGDALVAAIKAAELVPGERVWAAGEAAAVQRIRKHLFGPRAIPRAHAHVRGYWKHGRAGDTGD